MKLCKLSEQVDQGSLAEWVLDRCVQGDGGILGAQDGDPLLSDPCWNKIDFVQDQNLD